MLTSPNERICLDARRHGIVLVRPLVQACALAAVGGYALLRGWPWSVGGAVLAAVAAGVFLRAAWRWERTRLVVTTEKICLLHGTLIAGDLELDHVPEPRRVFGLVERLCP